MIQWPGRRSAASDALTTTHTIADLRTLAHRSTPRPIFDFIDGGAGDEVTVRRNTEAFRGVSLLPRVLRDVSRIDTGANFLGTRAGSPFGLAPVGMTRLAHPDGELAAVRAARELGVPYILSTMTSSSLEAVAQAAPEADRWFQLYLWKDRVASEALVRHAAELGYRALVLTADVPVAGQRLRDARNGMTLPPSFPLRSAARLALHPRWLARTLASEPLGFAALDVERGGFAEQSNRILDPSTTFDDLTWMRSIWSGPLVVKGVLSPADATEAVRRGADAVIVSNHGGRQLENAVATWDALPGVRDAVGDRTEVYVDGGIRSGTHIAAARAAGADAVFVGRPYVYGLMAGGEAGAVRAGRMLQTGLERTMALLGAPAVENLVPEMLAPPRMG
ncbi:alpha-hydroxy-acid oxidizing protein [Microbacterium sp. LRZ72]|uniref:alpha-hydroxy acid oxidase n=1 Tax=Microbacterium sp. LRZ72 TaxID=2942481 RepID=UPI0029A141B1|nr:alpha-hydroxy acid oxidase [Microbacterium sp. LRZ72]MDX2376355.1 alpha-hydroxy-acid oxidizing protein [Microbacterium sp. LRZ72]